MKRQWEQSNISGERSVIGIFTCCVLAVDEESYLLLDTESNIKMVSVKESMMRRRWRRSCMRCAINS